MGRAAAPCGCPSPSSERTRRVGRVRARVVSDGTPVSCTRPCLSGPGGGGGAGAVAPSPGSRIAGPTPRPPGTDPRPRSTPRRPPGGTTRASPRAGRPAEAAPGAAPRTRTAVPSAGAARAVRKRVDADGPWSVPAALRSGAAGQPTECQAGPYDRSRARAAAGRARFGPVRSAAGEGQPAGWVTGTPPVPERPSRAGRAGGGRRRPAPWRSPSWSAGRGAAAGTSAGDGAPAHCAGRTGSGGRTSPCRSPQGGTRRGRLPISPDRPPVAAGPQLIRGAPPPRPVPGRRVPWR